MQHDRPMLNVGNIRTKCPSYKHVTGSKRNDTWHILSATMLDQLPRLLHPGRSIIGLNSAAHTFLAINDFSRTAM